MLSNLDLLVPMEGLEPPHPFGYQILSLARLPFRHIGIISNEKYYARIKLKGKAIRKMKKGRKKASCGLELRASGSHYQAGAGASGADSFPETPESWRTR